jgi:transposase-like protein
MLLTPDRMDRIVALVAAGNYLSTAVKTEGISPATMYSWLKRGEEEKQKREKNEQTGPDADILIRFLDAVTKARGLAETHAVEIVESVMQGGHLISEEPVVSPKGDIVLGADGEPLMKRRYTTPDGKLALNYLAATNPAQWRPNNPQRIELTNPDNDGTHTITTTSDDTDRTLTIAERLRAHIEQSTREAIGPGEIIEGEIIND